MRATGDATKCGLTAAPAAAPGRRPSPRPAPRWARSSARYRSPRTCPARTSDAAPKAPACRGCRVARANGRCAGLPALRRSRARLAVDEPVIVLEKLDGTEPFKLGELRHVLGLDGDAGDREGAVRRGDFLATPVHRHVPEVRAPNVLCLELPGRNDPIALHLVGALQLCACHGLCPLWRGEGRPTPA